MGPRSRTPANTPPKLPGTPVIVPPTPTPATPGVSSGTTLTTATSSTPDTTSTATQSQHDVFYEPSEDHSERQANRRSMYRSTGTSSSPDLTTFLRKAKEKGGGINMQQYKNLKEREKRKEEPPPLPSHLHHDRPATASSSSSLTNTPTGRQRSATNGSPGPPYTANMSFRDPTTSGRKEDWMVSSPRSKDKLPKSSVRQKTSVFWGKMMGSSSTRDKFKADASASAPVTPTYTSPSLLDVFKPPVPPIPAEHRPAVPQSSTESPTSPSNMTKPLPPIVGSPLRDGVDPDQLSVVVIDKAPFMQGPSPVHNSSETVNGTPTQKRRSMSAGDADLKKKTVAASLDNPLPPTPKTREKMERDRKENLEESSLHNILDQFKGELSQLELTSSTPLDLQDPSTPARQTMHRRKMDDGTSSQRSSQDTAGKSSKQSMEELTNMTTIVPPRSSSLQLPLRPASGASSANSSPRPSHTIPSSGSLKPRAAINGVGSPRDTSRLRVLHRSTASNSEPSLLPIIDDARKLSQRRSSQQELSVNDLSLTRFPSSSQSSNMDDAELETRGKELARKCWDEDEEFLAKEKIAEFLGTFGRVNKVALHHYMEKFDFADLRLDVAFRRLCAKLFLKGETQQVDRILEEFSNRYWDCNPGGLYGNANIVHAVAYSLLLLNTDLHVADLVQRMSRSQFVKNTMTAIQSQLRPSPPGALSSSDLTYDDCSSSVRGAGSDDTETGGRSRRSDSIASWNSVPRDAIPNLSASVHGHSGATQHGNGSTPSVQVSTSGNDVRRSPTQFFGRAWEEDMESLLKEMYNAIKSQQILQPLNSSIGRASFSSLSPGGNILRNRSFRNQQNFKRGSIRGWQSMITAQSGASPYSSNSSIDGRASPAPSFATSAHEAMFGSTPAFLPPTLGFAHNLSHTIIREAQEDDDRSIHSEGSEATTISISDEELALLGAPWAKEGMLCRKQYCESAGKRAKDKSWLDVFVVIQKGELNMFTFGDHSTGNAGAVGGGNWLANANPVGTLHLAHSLANALPPPGYDKHRPYCMVLTLGNAGVYFFQAGTEELVNEWVSTCNYWAARVSKEPLTGGVSNMEYGWNRVMDPYGHVRSTSHNDNADASDGMSIRSGRSTRSGRLKFGWREGAATVRAGNSPWVDKTFINDWKEPLPPSVPSNHDEEAQLEALKKHVTALKKELEQHNELRGPMSGLYQPRSPNAIKAQSNWEKKSKYLLKEIVKYELYIDSLQNAMSLRLKKRGEKALERALNGASPDDASFVHKSKWKGPEEATIHEEPELLTPESSKTFGNRKHRREQAEDDEDDD